MRIVADENIPFAAEVFGKLGKVSLLSGRLITPDALKSADILLVRSITPVNRGLLEGTPVRFVGTATAGVDHVDTKYLQEAGIRFGHALGSNANSVANYFFALLFRYASVFNVALRGLKLGVVGAGNVGSRVADRAEKLGLKVLRNDPPLQDRGVPGDWASFEETCDCDIITVHTPLNEGGRYNTFHLFDGRSLRRIRKNAFFINASRGKVADNAALLEEIAGGRFSAVGLDVWENEPAVSMDLVRRVFSATPHIAGYSYDGKVRGTEMLFDSLCGFLGVSPQVDFNLLKQPVKDPVIELDNSAGSEEAILHSAIKAAYDIAGDDARMRLILGQSGAEAQGGYFDMLRKTYPVRREFENYTVNPLNPDAELSRKLAVLGFMVGSNNNKVPPIRHTPRI